MPETLETGISGPRAINVMVQRQGKANSGRNTQKYKLQGTVRQETQETLIKTHKRWLTRHSEKDEDDHKCI